MLLSKKVSEWKVNIYVPEYMFISTHICNLNTAEELSSEVSKLLVLVSSDVANKHHKMYENAF